MAGYDPGYAHSLHVPHENFANGIERGVKGLKLAIVENYTYRDVDPDVAKAVEEAVRTLESEGARIVNVKIPLLAKPVDFSSLFTIVLYEFNRILGNRYRAAPDKSKFGAIVQDDIAKGEKISRADYEKALTARAQLSAQFKAAFAHADALITPTMPTTAPVLAAGGPAYDRGRQFMLPISATGLPALSMPCGFDSAGLPVGLQLVGNARREALLLRIAHAHQRAMPVYAKRPSVYA
jgi:aspartyl-tRNA(Asn)/glutamyl-tRNA(Gln) amidotransferase subunit A